MIPITVIIPTKNEELAIADCVKAHSEFSEVFVVDSNSTDRTKEIATECGATVVNYTFDNRYPKKKQWCLDNLPISNEWVLFIDADELCSDKLLEHLRIEDWTSARSEAAYDISLSYSFSGTVLQYGHRVVKRSLFNRRLTNYPEVDDLDAPGMGEQEGHYQPRVKGAIGRLDKPILHHDPDPVSSWFGRHNRYSDWEAWLRVHPKTRKQVAELRSSQGKLFEKAPFKPLIFFLYTYVVKQGFRDGQAGLDYAVALAFYYWQIGLKTRELQQSGTVT